ncbi:MAG TPA: orotate phosphoribosyltransferase [Candidatus Brocadiia bacterium]|nr:orotate phosphoribosyltransferase [Candidatus Brocadiia bacterium]
MTPAELLRLFEQRQAVLNGHFLLSSGLHSPRYVQCALVLQYPDVTESLCRLLAAEFASDRVDVVVGPAMGAVTLAYELGRVLKCRALFTERTDGVVALRRGFALRPGERVLVCEDVLTTGKSAREVIAGVVEPAGAVLAGVASLIDRGGAADFAGIKVRSLLKVEAPTYAPDACPLCRQGLPLVKPGSRATPAAKAQGHA